MDWKLVATTFAAVFIAELGDKTQIATLSFSTSGSSRWAVFLGSSLALVTSSAIAVVAGEALVRVVPARVLHLAAGAVFVIIGAYLLFSALRSPR